MATKSALERLPADADTEKLVAAFVNACPHDFDGAFKDSSPDDVDQIIRDFYGYKTVRSMPRQVQELLGYEAHLGIGVVDVGSPMKLVGQPS